MSVQRGKWLCSWPRGVLAHLPTCQIEHDSAFKPIYVASVRFLSQQAAGNQPLPVHREQVSHMLLFYAVFNFAWKRPAVLTTNVSNWMNGMSRWCRGVCSVTGLVSCSIPLTMLLYRHSSLASHVIVQIRKLIHAGELKKTCPCRCSFVIPVQAESDKQYSTSHRHPFGASEDASSILAIESMTNVFLAEACSASGDLVYNSDTQCFLH